MSTDSVDRFTVFTPWPSLGILDDTQYEASGASPFEVNDTWGRIPDGCGDFKKIDDHPTLNDENADPNGAGGAPQCGRTGSGGNGGGAGSAGRRDRCV